MQTMARNPEHISKTVKLLRKTFSFTQENLADAANLTTRTIEKIESGHHQPNEQTLRSIARALGMDIRVFAQSTPDEKRRERVDMERAARKMLVVPTTPIKDARDFLGRFGQTGAARFDMSAVEGDEPMEVAAAMQDYIEDVLLGWSDLSQSDRLSVAHELFEMCAEMKGHGYLCHLGHYGQRLRARGKSDLVLGVALIVLLPRDQAEGERYAIVRIEGAWETLEEDRVQLPESWCSTSKPSS